MRERLTDSVGQTSSHEPVEFLVKPVVGLVSVVTARPASLDLVTSESKDPKLATVDESGQMVVEWAQFLPAVVFAVC